MTELQERLTGFGKPMPSRVNNGSTARDDLIQAADRANRWRRLIDERLIESGSDPEAFDEEGNVTETKLYAKPDKRNQSRKQKNKTSEMPGGAYITQFYKDGRVSKKGRIIFKTGSDVLFQTT